MSKITDNIEEALLYLQSGRLVAIPTETVYGLAADASSDKAIQAIYALKNRPFDKALALNVHPSWPISSWAEDTHPLLKKLIQTFWPGPLTIVLPAKTTNISRYILGPYKTIAFRCPNHPATLNLLEKFNKPIVAPSANPSNQLSPTTAKQVQNYFKNDELLILENKESYQEGIESTIVRLIDNSKDYEILRFGAISRDELKKCTGLFPITQPIRHAKPKPQLNIPMFYFVSVDQLKKFLKSHPKNLEKYLCLAKPNLINQLNPPFSISYPENGIEKKLYNLLHQAQNSDANIIFIHIPSTMNEAVQSRIKEFALPIL